MGTDIHAVFQKYNDQLSPPVWEEIPTTWEQSRHYLLFAALANVRNGYGFAGCDTEDRNQFLQLTGVSVSGYGDSSHVDSVACATADNMAAGMDEPHARIAALEEKLNRIKETLRGLQPLVEELILGDND